MERYAGRSLARSCLGPRGARSLTRWRRGVQLRSGRPCGSPRRQWPRDRPWWRRGRLVTQSRLPKSLAIGHCFSRTPPLPRGQGAGKFYRSNHLVDSGPPVRSQGHLPSTTKGNFVTLTEDVPRLWGAPCQTGGRPAAVILCLCLSV